MKGFFKKAILLFAMIGTMSFCVACGAKIIDISIDTEKLPQTVYVQGQDLNLDGVTFTVNTKKGTEEISLTDPEVEISGYDQNKLGEQTITITYQEQITSFKVTVVPRMTVKNLKTSYFVGETLDLSAGEVKIVKNDGTSFNVPVNSDKISISGFDSSKAQSSLALTIRYKDTATGENYEGTVEVNVHAVDANTTVYKQPNKVKYGSHETKLDFAGSYLKLKNADGTYTKDVTLTQELTEGFDPSLATAENTEDNPLVQEVTVSYAGVEMFSFEVKITYSDVSYIKDTAAALADYDWYSESVPEFTEDEKTEAITAMQKFLELRSKDKAYVTADEEEIIARPAAYFGTWKWIEAAETYKDTFSAAGGQFALTAKSYEKTKSDFERLENDDEPFIVLGEMLMEIKEEFGDLSLPRKVFGEGVEQELCTIDSLISTVVYDVSEMDDIKNMVAWMFEVYETLKDVPTTWTASTMETYGTDIQLLVAKMGGSEYQGASYRAIYRIITNWRSDFFDMIYTYYYTHIIDENDKMINISSLNNIKNIYLPSVLEELYEIVATAVNQIVYMGQGKVVDSTTFISTFQEAWGKAVAIADGENEMYKYLLANLRFEGVLNNPANLMEIVYVLRTTRFGYFQHMSGMAYNEAFSNLWESYLTMVKKLSEQQEYLNSTNFASDVTALFNAFVDMHPSEQYGFIASVNVFYESDAFPENSLVIDPEKNVSYNYFSGMLHTYYRNVLKASGAEEVFVNLLAAIEYYANGYMKDSAFSSFVASMRLVKNGYDSLADKTMFNSLLGNTYSKYLALYNEILNNQTHELTLTGEALDTFNALVKALDDASKVYETFDKEKYPSPEYIKFFSAYEKAASLENSLLATMEGANAYYKVCVTVNGSETTLEYAMYKVRKNFEKKITSIQLSGGFYVLYDVYQAYGLKAFMLQAYDVVWFDEEATLTEEMKTKILGVMEAFRALGTTNKGLTAKTLFLSLDRELNAYYEGLEAFFNVAFGENTEAVATAKLLLKVEKAYSNYEQKPDGKNEVDKPYSKIFTDAVEELKASYESLANKDAFAWLKDVYDYYVSEYEELTQSQE